MENIFKIEIISPEKTIFSESVYTYVPFGKETKPSFPIWISIF